jgi:hypothetical protein
LFGTATPRRPVLAILSDQFLLMFNPVHPINAKITQRFRCRVLHLVTPEIDQAVNVTILLKNRRSGYNKSFSVVAMDRTNLGTRVNVKGI